MFNSYRKLEIKYGYETYPVLRKVSKHPSYRMLDKKCYKSAKHITFR